MKTIIRNATVVDGTGAPRFAGEVAFEDDCIVAVGPQLSGSFDREIDAGGQIVCPGFIDTHSHSDLLRCARVPLNPKFIRESRQMCWGRMESLWRRCRGSM